MSSTPPQETRHPVLAAALAVQEQAKGVLDVEPVFMSTEDKAEALRALAQAERMMAGLRVTVMGAADDVAVEAGSRDVAAWMAAETSVDYRSVRGDLELAQRLERRCDVAGALRRGEISLAHAQAITSALDALPRDLPDDLVQQAETTLVGHAAELRPVQVARLGRRILEVVAPEIADAEEARRLRDQERRARRRQHVRFRPLGDGMTRIIIDVEGHVAARFKTYLEAYASPRRSSPDDRRPYGRRVAEAFGSLLEHLDPHRMPDHGGDATTVMVTISLDDLRRDLAAAGLIDGDLSAGHNLTADEARRLACTAHIVPVVLGGKGEILNLGRSRRLFSPAQRRAMRLRDQRCRAEGCTVPASWCEAHHLEPWSRGGRTDLDAGVLLCSFHHHRAHDPDFLRERLPNGDHRFTRRT